MWTTVTVSFVHHVGLNDGTRLLDLVRRALTCRAISPVRSSPSLKGLLVSTWFTFRNQVLGRPISTRKSPWKDENVRPTAALLSCLSPEFSREVQFYVFLKVNTLYHWFSKEAPGTSNVCTNSLSAHWVLSKFVFAACNLWVSNTCSQDKFTRLKPVSGWWGEIAQSIKYLPYKHQDLSLIPRTHVKEAWRVVCGSILSTGEKRPSPWGSMARHPSPLNEFQAGERHWPFSKTKKGSITWEMMCLGVCWVTCVCLYMYLCCWMCLDTRAHRHTPMQTPSCPYRFSVPFPLGNHGSYYPVLLPVTSQEYKCIRRHMLLKKK